MESFVFYKSFHEALKELPMDEYAKVMYAINEYALNDNEIELEGIAKIAFTLIKPQLDANKKRKESGAKGGRPSEKPMVSENEIEEKPMVSDYEEEIKPMVSKIDAEKKPNVNVNDNVNANDNVNDNGYITDGLKPHAPAKKARFVKPDVNLIKQYCIERNNGIDAQRFFDYYESKGWLVGKSPMKDWKAAVRNWENRTTSQTYAYDQKALPPDRLTL